MATNCRQKMANCRLRNMTIANADPGVELTWDWSWTQRSRNISIVSTMSATKTTKSFLSVTCPLPVQSNYGVSFSQWKSVWGIFAISFITCRCLQTQPSRRLVFWTAPSSVSVVLSRVVQGRTGCVYVREAGGGGAGIRIIIFKQNGIFSFVSLVDSFRRKWNSFKGISSCKLKKDDKKTSKNSPL